MSMYDPLYDRLHNDGRSMILLTFKEIDKIVKLPSSAYKPKHSWWGNDNVHTQALAWKKAGYKAKADFIQKTVIFTKSVNRNLGANIIKKTGIQETKKVSNNIESRLVELRREYYTCLNQKANLIALQLSKNQPVTNLILDSIKELYESAKAEKSIENDENYFETAYHNPISSELEFLIARILCNYSKMMNLGWKIYLRRQLGKTAPDIRIDKDNIPIGIIEVKAKAGWIQCVFSKERYDKDYKKYLEHKGTDPKIQVDKFRHQCEKYCQTYKITGDRIFVLLPSLILVHRKHSSQKIENYESFFHENSNLPSDSLVLLSNNPLLDLSANPSSIEYEATNRFENMITKISN